MHPNLSSDSSHKWLEVSEVAGTDEQVFDEEAPADNMMEMPVQVKLANFWPNNATVWFIRAEQEFVIKLVREYPGDDVCLLGVGLDGGGLHEGG